MTRILTAFACVGSLLAGAGAAQAGQTNPSPHQTTVHELRLSDGSTLYGEVVSETDTYVLFQTMGGATVKVARARIDTLKLVVGRTHEGQFRREDPNNTRLLFGPTGKSLPKGAVYLGVYEFLMPFVQVGVTDRISIGGGTPLFFGIDESNRPYWITPKVQLLSRAGTHVSAGAFHGFNGDGEGFGVAYGVLTRDVQSGSFTVGAGMGYTSEGDRGPVVMAGADAPMRRNMKLVTENYMWKSGGVASLGVRFFGENLSADVGIGVFFAAEGPIGGAPVVNFVYRF